MNENSYKNPFGLWKVTTEADVEGRSIKDLGIHEGFIDEIAFQLGFQGGYSLQFTAVDPKSLREKPSQKPVREITISFGVGSNFASFREPKKRAVQVATLFRDRPVRVQESPYYGSVVLVRGTTPQEEERLLVDAKREAALAKLTNEDREVLGL